jgi:membrane protease YdiL (CAAX protease family)
MRMIVAWAAMLIVSPLPEIISALITSNPFRWFFWFDFGALLVLLGLSFIQPTLRGLRGYLLAILAYIVGGLSWVLFRESTAYMNWVQNASWGVTQIAEVSGHLLGALLMALTLIGSGLTRRDLFLVKGDPNALAQPHPLHQTKEPRPWPRIIREWLPWYLGIMILVLVLTFRPDLSRAARALVFLPAAIIAAAINAFQEEFRFRSVLLPRLGPVLGSNPALWLTAVFFGLNHIIGSQPNGPWGFLLATYLGWLLGKSMLETRGFYWAFLIHFLGDFTIYVFEAIDQV